MRGICKGRLLTLLTMAACVCLLAGCGKESSTYDRKELPEDALSALTISSRSGDVVLHPVQGAPYAELTTLSKGFHLASSAQLDVTVEDGKTEVSTMVSESAGFGSTKSRLDLYLPADAVQTLVVKLTAGKFLCKDFTFDRVETRLTGGNMEFGDITAKRMELTILGGSLDVYGAYVDSTTLDLQGGRLSVEYLSDDTQLACTVKGGDMDAAGNFSKAHLKCNGGKIKLESGKVPRIMSCLVTGGAARIRLPESKEGFRAEYTTTGGEFKTDFMELPEGKKDGMVTVGDGYSIFSFEINGGEAALKKR